MTKKQKNILIQQLKEVVLKHGFTIDAWGNYVKKTANKSLRVKFKSINVRMEVKGATSKEWFKVFSTPIVKMIPEEFDNRLSIRLNTKLNITSK